MAFLAFLLGNGEPLCGPPDRLSNPTNCIIAATVAGAISVAWYLAIRCKTKRHRSPEYPASFLYLSGCSVGLFLLGFIGGLL